MATMHKILSTTTIFYLLVHLLQCSSSLKVHIEKKVIQGWANEQKCVNYTADFEVELSQEMQLSWQLEENNNLCMELRGPVGGWMELGLSRSQDFISDPPANVILYKNKERPIIVVLLKPGNNGTKALEENSTLSIVATVEENGVIKILVWRAFEAIASSDVPINENGINYIFWATGQVWSEAPSQDDFGIIAIDLKYGLLAVNDLQDIYFFFIIGATMIILLSLGYFFTRTSLTKTLLSRKLVNYRMGKPHWEEPKQPLGHFLDLTLADVLLLALLAFLNALIAFLYYHSLTKKSISKRSLGAIITGKLSAINLMLLIFPITRYNILHWSYQTSSAITIKFHRIISIYTLHLLVLHFLFASSLCNSILQHTSCGSHGNDPLYGFLSFFAFASMGIFAIEYFRRTIFEFFYYYHQVASILGLIFSALHSKTVAFLIITPCFFYVLGILDRLRSYSTSYYVSNIRNTCDVTIIKIPADHKWQSKLYNMHFGAYCYLCVPGISRLEWHPFFIMSGFEEKKSIILAVKSMGKGTFTDKLNKLCKRSVAFPVYLDGPLGTFNISIQDYQTLLLVGGGIRAAPLIPIISYIRGNPKLNISVILVWCVQLPLHFRALEDYMFSEEDSNMSILLYASKSSTTGSLLLSSGRQVNFTPGYPDIMAICSEFSGVDRVGVVASAPYGLTAQTQLAAQTYGLDFHKGLGW